MKRPKKKPSPGLFNIDATTYKFWLHGERKQEPLTAERLKALFENIEAWVDRPHPEPCSNCACPFIHPAYQCIEWATSGYWRPAKAVT